MKNEELVNYRYFFFLNPNLYSILQLETFYFYGCFMYRNRLFVLFKIGLKKYILFGTKCYNELAEFILPNSDFIILRNFFLDNFWFENMSIENICKDEGFPFFFYFSKIQRNELIEKKLIYLNWQNNFKYMYKKIMNMRFNFLKFAKFNVCRINNMFFIFLINKKLLLNKMKVKGSLRYYGFLFNLYIQICYNYLIFYFKNKKLK